MNDGRPIAADWLNRVFCEDALSGMARIPDGSIDLIVADPPYGLGKDYGNDSDKMADKHGVEAYLNWMEQWIDLALPKLKPNGSLYIFLTWRFSPEIFVMLKQRMIMNNEIIWDRRVPSMGGSTRSFTSVHDTIGFFAKQRAITSTSMRCAHSLRRRNQEGQVALDFRRRQVAGDRLQPEGLVERVAPAPRTSRAGRPSDAKAARNHRAHDQGIVPAGRHRARPLHGQRHHGGSGQASAAEILSVSN